LVTVATPSDIAAAALELPPAERAQLAQRLMASLDRDPEVEVAWDEEIRRRLAELEEGAAEITPAEDVFAAARGRLKR
jgi:putative addiction module component (TIGR02574 family)